MTKTDYMNEIKLILAQNYTEFELYPLVSDLLKSNTKDLSRRYVFNRKHSKLGEIFYGISSFPDIAILDKCFDNELHQYLVESNYNMLKGCVEVKSYSTTLYTLERINSKLNSDNELTETEKCDIGQLIGEILWYNKVLYTNGVEWRYFEFIPDRSQVSKIIELANETAKKLDIEWWYSDKFKAIFSTDSVKITLDRFISETIISKNCIENWDSFKNRLDMINWYTGRSTFDTE